MTSLQESSSRPSHWEDDRFAAVDRVVRRWWLAIFLTLMAMGWLVHGASA